METIKFFDKNLTNLRHFGYLEVLSLVCDNSEAKLRNFRKKKMFEMPFGVQRLIPISSPSWIL
jgi:hypothetical protein